MDVLSKAIKLIANISKLGYEAYIVGGAPRDVLLGIADDIYDVDIATNCPVRVLDENFHTYDVGKSRDFGIVVVTYETYAYEVAQFRTESDYDGARPGKVEIVSSLEADVKRRDLTINAIAMDKDRNIIDLVGGKEDLDNRIVRAVGDPKERFKENYVRMMRVARFASMAGFSVETHTRRAIRRMFRLINRVTPEHIGLELSKAAHKSGVQFAKFILMLDDLKLLAQILPEVSAMKYFKHDMQYHPEGSTVFKHTIECLKIMEDHIHISKIAALLHDIGKCVSFQDDKYGWKMTYHGHASSGARMAAAVMRKYKFSGWKVSTVEYAVKNHMKFHDLLDMKASKVASMVNSPHFHVLGDVAWADEFSRGETFARHEDFYDKVARAREIKKKWESHVVNSVVKIVDGRRIMELLNIKPGPEVGRIKKAVENRIIDDGIDPDDIELVNTLIMGAKER